MPSKRNNRFIQTQHPTHWRRTQSPQVHMFRFIFIYKFVVQHVGGSFPRMYVVVRCTHTHSQVHSYWTLLHRKKDNNSLLTHRSCLEGAHPTAVKRIPTSRWKAPAPTPKQWGILSQSFPPAGFFLYRWKKIGMHLPSRCLETGSTAESTRDCSLHRETQLKCHHHHHHCQDLGPSLVTTTTRHPDAAETVGAARHTVKEKQNTHTKKKHPQKIYRRWCCRAELQCQTAGKPPGWTQLVRTCSSPFLPVVLGCVVLCYARRVFWDGTKAAGGRHGNT